MTQHAPGERSRKRGPLALQRGMSLLELLFAVAVIAVIAVGVLGTTTALRNLQETTRNMSLATEEIQLKLEELASLQTFADLTAYDGTTFTPVHPDLQQASGKIYVLNDPADSRVTNGLAAGYNTIVGIDLAAVIVTFAWRDQNGRLYGEDANLNGVMDVGEDANANGWLDSPVELVTLVRRW